MKKLSYLVLIIALAFLAYYFSKSNEKTITKQNSNSNDFQNTSLNNNSSNKKESLPDSFKSGDDQNKKASNEELKVKVVETHDPKFEEFDRLEALWLKEVQEIFGREEYHYYQTLREVNEKEKMEAYQAFHDYMRSKSGNNFSYKITEDQTIREKKINEKYLNMLEKKVGASKFRQYISRRDALNEKNQRAKNGQNVIVIEF